MRNMIFASTFAAFLALGLLNVSGQAPAQPRGVLSVLRPDQPIALKDVGGRYEINVIENGPEALGHKIVEVGGDYLVVQDVTGITETRIPLFSIKSIVTLKIGK